MSAYVAGSVNKRIIALFDVDGTLTKPRLEVEPEMHAYLMALKERITIGVVGGSDLPKQKEQLGDNVTNEFHFSFSENGTTAFKAGEMLGQTSFATHLGEDKLKLLINFILGYYATLDIPVKRGTFIEYRNGMLNVSPVGRNCSRDERNDFEAFDKIHKVRETMVNVLQAKFPDYGLKYSIGGQISFDVFPIGWDKTFCLQYLPEGDYDEVHFFGDKTYEGGNDYEIFQHPRTIGHSIDDANPETTRKILEELFPEA